MEAGGIGFGLEGIGKQLKERLLAVPVYQRSYSWNDEQVADLCSDLRIAFAQKAPEYFLGTIVLTRSGAGGRESVIDGQQRLATTAMLYAAIRDEFQTRDDARRAKIVDEYLSMSDLKSAVDAPRLQLNSVDDTFFSKHVIAKDSSATPSRESHRRIVAAYARLREYVKKIADDAGASFVERLHDFAEFLKHQVRVVVLEVSNDTDAFMIFETLNDRGADLTIADLLKNVSVPPTTFLN